MSSSFAYVSRMDTLQATILNYRLKNLDEKINKEEKIKIAKVFNLFI